MGEVEVDQAAPSRKVGRLDRRIDAAPADIVDQDVDRRPFRQHAPAQILASRGISDIRRICPRFASALAHLLRGSGKRVRIARDKHDVGARLRRRQRDRPAKPAAAAGDQNAFAVQPELVEHSHASVPLALVAYFVLAGGAHLQSIEAR